MSETTLREFHERIDRLAAEDGCYRITTTQTSVCPVPVATKRFADRRTAAHAVRVVENYYATLRHHDPGIPRFEFIVCETASPASEKDGHSRATQYAWDFTRRPPAETPAAHRLLIDFCREILETVFEVLSARGLDAIERGIVERYQQTSQPTGDQDELCLAFLRSVAVELDARLTPIEQSNVLRAASKLLSPPTDRSDPLDAALSRLASMELMTGYSHAPSLGNTDGPRGTRRTVLPGYTLTIDSHRVVTLPITIEFFRRTPNATLSITQAKLIDDRKWRVVFRTATVDESTGLVSLPAADTR